MAGIWNMDGMPLPLMFQMPAIPGCPKMLPFPGISATPTIPTPAIPGWRLARRSNRRRAVCV
jgi:hypothetical protein